MANIHARAVAESLHARFLAGGNFAFAEPMRAGFPGVHPTAAVSNDIAAHWEEIGFSGLAVQSVGYVEEDDAEPSVHVYVIRGSKKAEYEISSRQAQVKVFVERVGKVAVRPEAARAVTPRGNLYLRRNRIACGSSCAPSSDQIAGTFGALVQKTRSTGADNPFFALSNNHVFAGGNHTPVGMPILAPSTIDAGPNRPGPIEFCRHSEICELRSGDPVLVPPVREDVAIAQVSDPSRVSSWQGDNTEGFDTPQRVMTPELA